MSDFADSEVSRVAVLAMDALMEQTADACVKMGYAQTRLQRYIELLEDEVRAALGEHALALHRAQIDRRFPIHGESKETDK